MDGSFRSGLVGILYAEDFDAPQGAELVLAREPLGRGDASSGILEMPELVEPSFTVADLDAARAAGRAEGEAELQAALAAQAEHDRARTLAAIAAAVAETRAEARRVADESAEALARTMLSALAAALPAACARHGDTEVRALVGALLPHLQDEPRITIRVSPHSADALRGDLAALDEDAAARVHLLCTDAILPGDARITWQDGTATRDAQAAWNAVRDTLAPLGLLDAAGLRDAAGLLPTQQFPHPAELPAEPMRMAHV